MFYLAQAIAGEMLFFVECARLQLCNFVCNHATLQKISSCNFQNIRAMALRSSHVAPTWQHPAMGLGTDLFQSPLYGSGTLFRCILHLLRHFPSSALAWTWRHTSSNSVTRNYCRRAREVTLSCMDTLIALTGLLTRARFAVTGATFVLYAIDLCYGED